MRPEPSLCAAHTRPDGSAAASLPAERDPTSRQQSEGGPGGSTDAEPRAASLPDPGVVFVFILFPKTAQLCQGDKAPLQSSLARGDRGQGTATRHLPRAS